MDGAASVDGGVVEREVENELVNEENEEGNSENEEGVEAGGWGVEGLVDGNRG